MQGSECRWRWRNRSSPTVINSSLIVRSVWTCWHGANHASMVRSSQYISQLRVIVSRTTDPGPKVLSATARWCLGWMFVPTVLVFDFADFVLFALETRGNWHLLIERVLWWIVDGRHKQLFKKHSCSLQHLQSAAQHSAAVCLLYTNVIVNDEAITPDFSGIPRML